MIPEIGATSPDPHRDDSGPARLDSAELVSLVRDAIASHRDEPAVSCGTESITYGELDERVDRLAARLRQRGVQAESIVALLVERSVEMIVSVLGIQRAGGAYLPIEASNPSARVEFLLADSATTVLITTTALRHQAPAYPESSILYLDAPGDAAAGQSAPTGLPPIAPSQLAYVIYTSGSTGEPKGVQVEHLSVVNLLRGMRDSFAVGRGDTVVGIASLAFDMSVPDVFLPLTSGAHLVIAPRDVATSPNALKALLDQSGVTLMQATPSTWRLLVEAGWSARGTMTAICGGEELPRSLADQILGRGVELWNLYGPTEATVWATMTRIVPGPLPISVGHAMRNVRTWIAGIDGRTVPAGELGELWIGGAGLARGYLNRPELTAERFVVAADPDGGPDVRAYRTGDLARADGESIVFAGRLDSQVKLRGYRIELGEIEAALVNLEEVRAAAVVLRPDVNGEPHLVAFVARARRRTIAATALRRRLLGVLPAHMVPDVIVAVDELPLSANGKVDRSRLPVVPRHTHGRSGDAPRLVAPRTPLEQQLVDIWEAVLQIHSIGVTDDFFELGATSIAAAAVFDRVERELGARLPLSPLFQAPTIEKLAALIDTPAPRGRYTSLVPIQDRGTRTPVYCVHGGAGTILHFHALARTLGPDRPLYGLQMRGLYGDQPTHTTVEEMAEHFLSEVRQVQPHGPYIVGGYCFGALVAFEMAKRLDQAGEAVTLAFAINGPSAAYIRKYGARWMRGPNDATEEPAAGTGRVALRIRQFWWQLRTRQGRRALRQEFGAASLRQGAARGMRRWRRKTLGLLAVLYARFGVPLPDGWRQPGIFEICHWAERHYQPTPYRGRFVLFTAPLLYRESELGWTGLAAGGLDLQDLPGQHFSQRDAMRQPYIESVKAYIDAVS